ncbi:MAG: LD-carboxypeptidase [Bacteroidetes bacterium]|nr:LD-carboxypeptidase [Bacteroidota bacterium]
MIKPAALKKGDTIGIIAPASAPSSFEKIEKGAVYLERLGYRVKLGTHVREVHGFLAGTDEQRAYDIHEMFVDHSVKAIFCVRGGYGTYRLLPLLNYSLIKKNPKILVGYSDITALQLAIYKKTGLISFSGPMTGVEMWNGIDPYTEENFWRMITSTKKFGTISNPQNMPFSSRNKGKARGILIGGNLSLICALMGTQYIPSFKNSILFFEEIEETPARFDRMVNHLRISSAFKETNGILVGELTDIKEENAKVTVSADEILNEHFAQFKKPILQGLAYGHIPRKATIPIGVTAAIDAKNKTLSIDESAVT